MSTLSVVESLVSAQYAIDHHDSDSAPPPYDDYDRCRAELDRLTATERLELPELLEHSRSELRVEAAKAAGYLGLVEAKEALEHGLEDDEAKMRDACAEALVSITPSTALISIAARYAAISHRPLAAAANAAIATIGVAAIEFLLAADADPFDSGSAAWDSLYASHPAETTDALERGMCTGRHLWVMGVSRIVVAKGGDWSRDVFLMLADHPDERVRRAVAEALAKIGGPAETDAVLSILGKGGWPGHEAVRAAFELGRRTETAVAGRAIALLPTSSEEFDRVLLWTEIVKVAASPWEAPSRAAIVAGIEGALADESENVVAAAVRVATALHAAELSPKIVAALSHEKWCYGDFSAAVTAYLVDIGAEACADLARAIERATSASATPAEQRLGARAANFIFRCGDHARPHIDVLMRALKNADVETRQAAAVALGMLGEPQTRDALLEAAATDAPSIAYRCVQALVKLGDPRVVGPALAYVKPFVEGAALGGPETSSMSSSCLAALDFVATPEAIDALHRGVSHADPRIRRDAARALEKLRGAPTT